MHAIPLLRDIQAVKHEYGPGDRVLAVVSSELNVDQMTKIARAVKQYTRNDVRLIIINKTHTEMSIKRADGTTHELVKLEFTPDNSKLGAVGLHCAKVILTPHDVLLVSTAAKYRQDLEFCVKRWVDGICDFAVLVRK